MQRKHSSIEDVIADMEACAEQYHNGLRLEPKTIAHVFDSFTYELSFYTTGALLQECLRRVRLRADDALRAYDENAETAPPNMPQRERAKRAEYLKGVLHGVHQILTDLEMKQPLQLGEASKAPLRTKNPLPSSVAKPDGSKPN